MFWHANNPGRPEHHRKHRQVRASPPASAAIKVAGASGRAKTAAPISMCDGVFMTSADWVRHGCFVLCNPAQQRIGIAPFRTVRPTPSRGCRQTRICRQVPASGRGLPALPGMSCRGPAGRQSRPTSAATRRTEASSATSGVRMKRRRSSCCLPAVQPRPTRARRQARRAVRRWGFMWTRRKEAGNSASNVSRSRSSARQ